MALTATIDRFEGEAAVLIQDSEAGRIGAKVDVARSLLPEGARAGDVILLSCSLGGGEAETVRRALSGARLDRQAAEERSERARQRVRRLRRRGERR